MNEEQTIPLQEATRVTIETVGTNVDIRWYQDAEDISFSGAELAVDRAADELFLRADRSGGRRAGRRGSGSGRLSVMLPLAIKVTKIEIEDGDGTLENPTGQVDCAVKSGSLRSTGGSAELTAIVGSDDLHIADLEGSIQAIGGSGDVEISACRATTNVKAGSGDVTLQGLSGDAIKITAGSGDVEITECESEAFAVEAGSGNVSLSGGNLERITARNGSGDVTSSTVFGPYVQSFMTGSGSVSLGVPQGLAARFEATTSRGEIDSQLPLVTVGQRGPRSRHTRRQVGSIGEGDQRAEVSIRTGTGDIRLHWLSATAGEQRSWKRSTPDTASKSTSEPKSGSTAKSPGDAPSTAKEILESLSRGEITVDEADALLAKLDRRGSD